MVFIGPNRRSDRTVIEQHIQLDPEEMSSFPPELGERLHGVLVEAEVPDAQEWLERFTPASERAAEFASAYCQLALVLQQGTGHEVTEHGFRPRNTPGRFELHFEYEQVEVGARAAELALSALGEVIPALRWEPRLLDGDRSFSALYRDFRAYSAERALPVDTAAICAAAANLDVPCTKLDRPPYKGSRGAFRIRHNGLLMLGHCRFQHIVDGTLCVDRCAAAAPLVSDREALLQRLLQLELPLPRQDLEFRNLVTASRAARAAARIGYPVAVKPATRSARDGLTLNVRNREELDAAVEKARRFSRQIMVEQHVPGETCRVVIANGAFIGAVADPAGTDLSDQIHATTRTLAENLADTLGVGLLVLTVVSPDISKPLRQQGAVVDLEVAPELDSFLSRGSPLLKRAAEEFVKWLFPPGAPSRIPIVSVTGTNGKTTTSRMVAQIMQTTGHSVSLVSTDGFYVNGKLAGKYDEYSATVIFKQFESPELTFAVIENHFGRIVRSGYAFRFCDIGVCTNVSDDHLGRAGIHSVEDMAAVKRSMLERARSAVVLNADNEHTLAMAAHFPAEKVCLTSMRASGNSKDLRDRSGALCNIEQEDAEDWVVWHQNGARVPVMPVTQIPATLEGKARFNTANALQAIATALLVGADVEVVRQSMATFTMDYATTPGRLNIYNGLPYRVIVDYAHNPDGLRNLCDFVDALDVKGRRTLVLDVPANRPDEAFVRAAEIAAGSFENFYCKNFEPMDRPVEEGPMLLRDALIRNGAVPDHIQIFPGECNTAAAVRALEEAREEDLVVILAGPDERGQLHQRLGELGARDLGHA